MTSSDQLEENKCHLHRKVIVLLRLDMELRLTIDRGPTRIQAAVEIRYGIRHLLWVKIIGLSPLV